MIVYESSGVEIYKVVPLEKSDVERFYIASVVLKDYKTNVIVFGTELIELKGALAKYGIDFDYKELKEDAQCFNTAGYLESVAVDDKTLCDTRAFRFYAPLLGDYYYVAFVRTRWNNYMIVKMAVGDTPKEAVRQATEKLLREIATRI